MAHPLSRRSPATPTGHVSRRSGSIELARHPADTLATERIPGRRLHLRLGCSPALDLPKLCALRLQLQTLDANIACA